MGISAGFRARIVPTFAAVLGAVVTALLGNWQLNRAAGKEALQQRIDAMAREPAIHVGAQAIDPDALVYRNVQAVGEFDESATVYLDNKVRDGMPGYEIVSPLKLRDSSRYVLVDRGWVQAVRTRAELPAIRTPEDEVIVLGIALPGNPPVFELSDQIRNGKVWQNLTVDRHRQAYGLELQPIFIHQQNDLDDGLLRQWRRPDVGIERHRAYAFQWFSLCAVIVVLYVILNVRRKTRS